MLWSVVYSSWLGFADILGFAHWSLYLLMCFSISFLLLEGCCIYVSLITSYGSWDFILFFRSFLFFVFPFGHFLLTWLWTCYQMSLTADGCSSRENESQVKEARNSWLSGSTPGLLGLGCGGPMLRRDRAHCGKLFRDHLPPKALQSTAWVFHLGMDDSFILASVEAESSHEVLLNGLSLCKI